MGFAIVPTGCETESSYAAEREKLRNAPKPPPVLVLKHHVGGTHHRVVVRGEYTYSTFANSLLTASTATSTVLNSLELLPFGTCGAAVELVEVPGADEFVAVLEGTAVMRISVADPSLPRVVATRRTREIGFAPRRASVADGEIWIAGDAGIVPWSMVAAPFTAGSPAERSANEKAGASDATPTPLLAGPLAEARAGLSATDVEAERGLVGTVVATDRGLVAPIGRRVYEIRTGGYVGAATRIEAVPEAEAARVGETALFTFQLAVQAGSDGPVGAQVGLMGRDVREIDASAVPGTVRRVKLARGVLFAVTDTDIVAFGVTRGPEGLTLGEPTFIPVRGARDIAAINENEFVVVGSFGRAYYRWRAGKGGEADTFYNTRREPSRLTHASTDRRRILAGGPEGSWLYTIGDDVAQVDQPVPMEPGTRDSVSGGWGKAVVAADRRSVTITGGSPVPAAGAQTSGAAPAGASWTWKPNTGGAVQGVESFDGKLWIWHDDGIDVLGAQGSAVGALQPMGAVRLEGSVKYLFPQRVGGAVAYVSEFGGFGLIDFIEREALPATGGERLVDLDADGDDDVQLTKAEAAGATSAREGGRINVPTGRDRDDLEMPAKR